MFRSRCAWLIHLRRTPPGSSGSPEFKEITFSGSAPRHLARSAGQAQACVPRQRLRHRGNSSPTATARPPRSSRWQTCEGARPHAARAVRPLRDRRRRSGDHGHRPAAGRPEAARDGQPQDRRHRLFEMNEAFASQAVYCHEGARPPREKLNVNGGAIALGHPLGCTGAKLTATALYELKRRGGGTQSSRCASAAARAPPASSKGCNDGDGSERTHGQGRRVAD